MIETLRVSSAHILPRYCDAGCQNIVALEKLVLVKRSTDDLEPLGLAVCCYDICMFNKANMYGQNKSIQRYLQ